MKKFYLSIAAILLVITAFAQSPQKMSYQAVIRNASNNLVANKPIGMQISILQGSASGVAVYKEVYSPNPTTNANGLVMIELGSGTPVLGSFAAINWANGPYYIKTETDPLGGTSYTISGVSQLLSVPYALYAKNTENVNDADADPTNEIQTMSISGTNLTLSKGGGTVTLPSSGGGDNWGTQTAITDATLAGNGSAASPLKVAQQAATTGQVLKWNGAAWAPGADVSAAGGLTLPYSQSISNATTAFSITNSLATAIMGRSTSTTGLACGVLGSASSPDGFGVYGNSSYVGMMGESLNNTGAAYGVVGTTHSPLGCSIWGVTDSGTGVTYGVKGESFSVSGYGVSGYSPNVGVRGVSTGSSGSGVSGTGVNIGVSGSATGTSGQVFAVIGETQSPVGYGIFGGNYSYTGTTYGVYGKVNSPNGFSGYFDGGKFYTNSKIGIGTTTPEFDIDINKSADAATLRLKSATNGALIVLDQIGDFNNHFSFIIFRKGGTNAFFTGMNYDQYQIFNDANKGLEVKANGTVRVTDLLTLDEGKRIGIGTTAPSAAIHVKGNSFPNSFIFLEAAAANDAGLRLYEGGVAKWHIFNNSKFDGLQIYNSVGTTAFFVKQANSYVGINTTTPNYNLEVNGTAGKTGGGSWTTSSDIRLKNVTGKYKKGLTEIAALQPVTFTYKEGNARNLPTNTEQIGFVAQEVQKVFPEAVTKAADDYLDFNIHAINVALVNAVKELKDENDRLKKEIDQFNSRLSMLEKLSQK
jgi:hypothetical protein